MPGQAQPQPQPNPPAHLFLAAGTRLPANRRLPLPTPSASSSPNPLDRGGCSQQLHHHHHHLQGPIQQQQDGQGEERSEPVQRTEQQRFADILCRFTTYVPTPYCFLICTTCRVVLPLTRVPSHFSAPAHNYTKADARRLLTYWSAEYLPTNPILIQTEGDLANWTLPHPVPPPKAIYPL
ncbi:hypothetical protein EJ04DRAFT_530307, partial [Polyplosphaeria fusca]